MWLIIQAGISEMMIAKDLLLQFPTAKFDAMAQHLEYALIRLKENFYFFQTIFLQQLKIYIISEISFISSHYVIVCYGPKYMLMHCT